MEESDEYGSTPGIGLIPGKVKKLSLTITDQKRLPHIGWNTIHTNFNGCRDSSKTLFHGIKPEHSVYFLHSYAAYPSDKNNILSMTTYGDCEFASSIVSRNVYGCQFHPEKSRDIGLKILENFGRIELNENTIYPCINKVSL
jgi:glutamine amidotransferase